MVELGAKPRPAGCLSTTRPGQVYGVDVNLRFAKEHTSQFRLPPSSHPPLGHSGPIGGVTSTNEIPSWCLPGPHATPGTRVPRGPYTSSLLGDLLGSHLGRIQTGNVTCTWQAPRKQLAPPAGSLGVSVRPLPLCHVPHLVTGSIILPRKNGRWTSNRPSAPQIQVTPSAPPISFQ